MALDMKLFNGEKQIKRPTQILRCPLCGKDVERLYPIKLEVNEKTFRKIAETTNNIQIIKIEPCNRLTGKIDDVELHVIEGNCYHVNIQACVPCIDKIGWRHKFLLNKARKYATRFT